MGQLQRCLGRPFERACRLRTVTGTNNTSNAAINQPNMSNPQNLRTRIGTLRVFEWKLYRRPESSDTKGTSVTDDTRCVFARGSWRQQHVQTTAQTRKTSAVEKPCNQVDVDSVPEEYDWNGEVQPTSRSNRRNFRHLEAGYHVRFDETDHDVCGILFLSSAGGGRPFFGGQEARAQHVVVRLSGVEWHVRETQSYRLETIVGVRSRLLLRLVMYCMQMLQECNIALPAAVTFIASVLYYNSMLFVIHPSSRAIAQ
jgi:hypothetical protein